MKTLMNLFFISLFVFCVTSLFAQNQTYGVIEGDGTGTATVLHTTKYVGIGTSSPAAWLDVDGSNTYGQAYGVRADEDIDVTNFDGEVIGQLGHTAMWAAYKRSFGVAGMVDNVADLGGLSGNTSQAIGGYFRVDLDDLSATSNCDYVIAGCNTRLTGSITSYPSSGIVASLYAQDVINSSGTYAGYFEGRGYFSGNVGIGTSNPTEAIDVVGNVQVSGNILGGTTDDNLLIYAATGSNDGATINLYSDNEATTPGQMKLLAGSSGSIEFWTGGYPGGSQKMKLINNGNFGIGATSPLSKLCVGDNGHASYYTSIYSSSTATGIVGLVVRQEAATSTGTSRGVLGKINIPESASYAGYYRGVWGDAKRASEYQNGRAYGVYGRAGNCTDGYNYGVFGNLEGDSEGAAVYGGVDDYNGHGTGGTYAGYFYGDVYVTGTMSAGIVVDRSDKRLTGNVQPLDESSDKLFQLEGIKYVLIPNANKSLDTTQTPVEDNSLGYYKDKVQYGFNAQKVQKIYPDLVYEGSDGYLGINYKGFIPLIINMLKEQQSVIDDQNQTIEDQEVQIEELQNALTNAGILINETGTIKLQQNNPNPFNESTEIKYSLSNDIQSAEIMIFDMNGTNLKAYKVDISENGKLTINANELKPGMYIYSLIADGKEVGTKRMIITE